jgi:hypothetical protein
MAQKFSVLTNEGVETFTVIPGLDQAAIELTKFVEHLQEKYPNLSASEAGWVAAYFVSNFPRMIDANPNLSEAVDITVIFVKNNRINNA